MKRVPCVAKHLNLGVLALVLTTVIRASFALVTPLPFQHVNGITKNPAFLQLRARLASPTECSMQAADGEAGDSSGDRDPEEAEEPEEDPEVVALKEEIGKLEGELKGKKSSLAYALDQVDEYSKAGYARAVAEMENMRRVRSNMNSSSKSIAMAGVLRDFLPVYDKMEMLREKYQNDEFGSKYGGLSIGPTFTKMGVKEFSVAEGGPVDFSRISVVGSELSDAAKDTIIQQIRPGLELEGNVIRAAECISSAGSEEVNSANDAEVAADESAEG